MARSWLAVMLSLLAAVAWYLGYPNNYLEPSDLIMLTCCFSAANGWLVSRPTNSIALRSSLLLLLHRLAGQGVARQSSAHSYSRCVAVDVVQWTAAGRCGVRGPTARRRAVRTVCVGVSGAVTTHYLSTTDDRAPATPSRHPPARSQTHHVPVYTALLSALPFSLKFIPPTDLTLLPSFTDSDSGNM